MDSNDLAIGPTAERMEPLPSVAPAQGEAPAQNQQHQPRRRPPPDESVAGKTVGESASDSASETHPASASDNGPDPEDEGPPHRIDSLA